MKQRVKKLNEKCETLRNNVAVNDMLHESFKERIRIKYLYDSNDDESEYESDDDIRENNRLNFILKKIEEHKKKIKCDKCNFTAKTQGGLKTHKTKKHKEIK